MADQQTHTIKKIAGKDKPLLLNQLFTAFLHLLEQKPRAITTRLSGKKLSLKLRVLKRFSPFLLAALFSPVLFTYWFVAGSVNRWLLFLLFVVIESNLFYFDIVLWKYLEGKKMLRIWIIEMFMLFATAFFLA